MLPHSDKIFFCGAWDNFEEVVYEWFVEGIKLRDEFQSIHWERKIVFIWNFSSLRDSIEFHWTHDKWKIGQLFYDATARSVDEGKEWINLHLNHEDKNLAEY